MPLILTKEQLSEQVWRMRLEAPRIARKRRAGQFVMIRPTETTERIPLTIANANADEGWIEIIFQVVGATTSVMAAMHEQSSVTDLAGPLGKPTHIENFGKCVCIGGGVGVAPLYPIVSALSEAGNDVTTIIGARSKELLILEKEMKEKSSRVEVATDDGSYGTKGFVTGVFENLISEGNTFDFAAVIGPVMMMKFTTKLTVEAGIPTVASLNPIMIDGTGMCGGCRVTIDGKTKFACVDGPEFDAAKIDWDGLIRRLSSYVPFEREALEAHTCKLRY